MINFPNSLDSLTNPTSTDLMENAVAALDHDVQHSNANDAIEALEVKVGINGSAVTTTHDYKLSAVTGSAKALTSGTSTQSVTGLTLVSPTLTLTSDATGDMYYRNSGGALTRLPIGSTLQILNVDASGIPAWVANPSATTATYSTAGIATIDANVRYYAADAGSNDTYVITLSPAPTAYTTGMKISFKANTVNTGAATLNVNSLGAKTIVKGVNTTLADGDIAAGMFCTVIYDGTNFVLQNPVTTALTPTFSGLFKNGTTTYDVSTASGTQNIAHGLGIIPKKIRLTFDGHGSSSGTSHNIATISYNGTTCSIVGSGYANSAYWDMNSSGTLIAYGPTGGSQSEYASGVITFDATNIIITWTKVNSPTGTYQIMWEAEA